MPSLMLLIKPVSSNCNMRCRYCFYTDTAKHRATPSYGVMSLPTMENVVKKALAASNRQCTFAFQGGEPTLAGLDFYKAFIGVVNRHNHKQLQVQYAIQTNGNSIDRDWAAFLAAHHFLVVFRWTEPEIFTICTAEIRRTMGLFLMLNTRRSSLIITVLIIIYLR